MPNKLPISLEEFMELSLDILCTIDKNGLFVSVNQASEKIWGYKPEELEGKLFLDYVAPQDLEATKNIDQKIIKGKEVSYFENHYVHKKGYLVPMIWSSKYDKGKEIIYCVAKETTEIKKKESAREKILRSSQSIINGTQNLIWSIDKDYNLLACNQAMRDRFLSDLKFDLKIGQNMLDIPMFTREYLEKWKLLYDKCLNGEKINIEIAPTDKTVVKAAWIQANLTPIYDNENIIGLVCHSTDITEKVLNKKIIERALEEKKNILESISDSFYALDNDYNFTYVNKSALKAIRKSRNELIGKNIFDVFPRLENTVFEEYLDKVKENGQPAQFEFYYHYFDQWFDESIYPSQDGFSVYFKDITKRKIISQALAESYEKESEILESISDAFYAIDHDFNFTYLNQKAEKLLNIKKEDALGKNIWEIFQYAKNSIAEKEYKTSLKNNEPRVFNYYYEPLKTWFNAKSYPSKNGLSVYFRDITQEKEYQDKLEYLNSELKIYTKKLEISNKELEQFAYIASHDLQEPLRMVSSFMNQLKKKYDEQLDDKARTYINFAVDGVHRMRQIIIDLLEFSRAGTQQEDLEKLDLNEEMAEVLSLLHSNLNEKNIDLEIEELPEVIYSKTAIRQLFHNLIGNAIKYSKKDVNPKIEVKWKENENEFQFEIKDNGIGIDEKFHEKIFQIFQRLHSKSEYAGTGLGLAICKKIVERYRGNIWIESQLGKGSSFFFTLQKNTHYE
ncbi:PAS domain S-box protein [Marivirga salinae]|uniref:histidine kinase n=1 Tax=Marivirga salinarum TaxID=3059078 RepID=A0AA51N8K9_9BACT|nr:PAS domain S-box protein [Marivirga sp. BDSF4-3]WMN10777.1 PAS domain S-box protein [Marivirga sp. BDSF4-3]